jgi:aryl-alcohol dehydrogenase-like predicted oxidoreductase
MKRAMPYHSISRREFLASAVTTAALVLSGGRAMAESIVRKPIPRTGEALPVIGLGTWQTFDVGTSQAAREPLKEVLREFVRAGGSVIDSSPMYGNSETVAGDIAHELGLHKQLFLATKVWTSGREAGVRQMEESFRRLRAQRMDLMQVHNLVDYRTHLETLRRWKEQVKVHYIGVTHYTSSAYDQLARVLASEELDFVQLNYSLAEREAEKRLLPLAAEKQLGVLVNRPFAEGRLFRRAAGKPLPSWAKEIGCASWAQFFLKFIVSHPAVTCAIPATSKVAHLTDNMRAGLAPMPDAATRERMARYFDEL